MLSFIPKHWRGEYSLPIACSVLGIVAVVLSRLFIVALRFATDYISYNPSALFFLYSIAWLSVGLLVGWYLVGVWRSANAYQIEKLGRQIWVRVAKVTVLLGALLALIVLRQLVAPQFSELFDVAFKGDTRIPDYTLKIENGGTELHFDGGIKYGLADDIEKIISENPAAKIVVFNSSGGRFGEARKIFHFMQGNNLSAVVNERCISACAFAFAGGQHRWLGIGGVLGFHSTLFTGIGELNGAERQAGFVAEIQAQDNIPPAFFAHLTGVHPQDMWYPTKKELLDGNFLTEKISAADSSKKKIEQVLTDFTTEIRKNLPKMLDTITTLIGVEVDHNRMVYLYEITKSGESFFYNSVFTTALSQKIAAAACRNDGIRSALNSGVVYEYRYVNADLHKMILDYALTECS